MPIDKGNSIFGCLGLFGGLGERGMTKGGDRFGVVGGGA